MGSNFGDHRRSDGKLKMIDQKTKVALKSIRSKHQFIPGTSFIPSTPGSIKSRNGLWKVSIIGTVPWKSDKKTSNLFASSLLDSTAQTLNLTGNSFGTIFAGNMADQTFDSLDNVIDDSMARSGMTIKVPANTRFKVIFP